MGDGSTNINVVGAGMGSAGAPTAFQAWSKSCEDTLALQGGLYQWALTQQSQRFQDRQVIDSEMFGLYKSQIDADFLLYKGNRDNYDSLKAEISDLKTQVAVSAAIRPYKVSVWDLIDAEIEPLTNEQRNMLATNEEYVANYNNLQSMVQAEVLNLVRANIENSPEGKALLDNQLKLVKNLKTSIIEMSQREMQLFNAFKEASAKNPSLTYEEFIKTMK